MYQIYVSFVCLPGQREAFVARVKEEGILADILAEDGCHRYDYYFSEANENELLLIEEWETKHHQEVHIGQPHMMRMHAFKDEYVASTKLGEFELK